MENEHPYKKWENREPQCEEFGFAENDIPRIKKAEEMFNNIDSFKPSKELEALREKMEQTKYRDLDNLSFVLSILIVVGIFVAFFTGGFTEFSWEGLGYAYILLMVGGIAVVGFVMIPVSHFITDPLEDLINKDCNETRQKLSSLEEEEKEKHREFVELMYGRAYELSDNLANYYAALDYYNKCQNARQLEYWDKLQGGDGNDFEWACAEFLEDRGFTTEVTPIGPDNGIDIYAQKDGLNYVCQCKALGTKVSTGEIQRFIGVVVSGPYVAGFFFSLNGFSENAIKAAKNSPRKIYCLSKIELTEGFIY